MKYGRCVSSEKTCRFTEKKREKEQLSLLGCGSAPLYVHYAGEIWKHSFIFTDRPTDHTYPFRERTFSKTLFKPEEFENADFAF